MAWRPLDCIIPSTGTLYSNLDSTQPGGFVEHKHGISWHSPKCVIELRKYDTRGVFEFSIIWVLWNEEDSCGRDEGIYQNHRVSGNILCTSCNRWGAVAILGSELGQNSAFVSVPLKLGFSCIRVSNQWRPCVMATCSCAKRRTSPSSIIIIDTALLHTDSCFWGRMCTMNPVLCSIARPSSTTGLSLPRAFSVEFWISATIAFARI